jgi:hypothetical protein
MPQGGSTVIHGGWTGGHTGGMLLLSEDVYGGLRIIENTLLKRKR